MELDILLQFIKEQGFRTKAEIKAAFAKEDQEVLDTYLDSLVEKNQVRRVSCRTASGNIPLFFIRGD